MMRSFLAAIALGMLGAVAAHAADFRVAEDGEAQGLPAVAYDSGGNRFFAVWYDARNGRAAALDLYGRILDGSGQPLTGDIPIALAKRSQSNPAVAYDAVNNRFLVVWADWRDAANVDSDIYGRLFDTSGAPYGSEFRIAARRGVSQKTPNLAFDPVRQRFLVLWMDRRNGGEDKIYGRFIGTDGVPQGNDFPIAPAGNAQDSPTLLFDPGRDRFVIAWRDVRPVGGDRLEKAVVGSFVDAGTGPAGTSFPIADEPIECAPLSLQALGLAPTQGHYFITWSSGRNYRETLPGPEWHDNRPGYDDRQMGFDVYGAFIGVEDGSLRGEPFMIAGGIDHQRAPAVAYGSNRDRFLVVWHDLRRPPSNRDNDIYGRYVSPTGEMSSEFLVSDAAATGPRQLPAVAFDPRGDTFVVLWEDGRHGRGVETRIYGATVR